MLISTSIFGPALALDDDSTSFEKIKGNEKVIYSSEEANIDELITRIRDGVTDNIGEGVVEEPILVNTDIIKKREGPFSRSEAKNSKLLKRVAGDGYMVDTYQVSAVALFFDDNGALANSAEEVQFGMGESNNSGISPMTTRNDHDIAITSTMYYNVYYGDSGYIEYLQITSGQGKVVDNSSQYNVGLLKMYMEINFDMGADYYTKTTYKDMPTSGVTYTNPPAYSAKFTYDYATTAEEDSVVTIYNSSTSITLSPVRATI